MRGETGVDAVHFRKHGNSGGAGERGNHGAEKDGAVTVLHPQRDQFGQQAHAKRHYQQFDDVEIVQPRVAKQLPEALCGKERPCHQHGDRHTQVAEVIAEAGDDRRVAQQHVRRKGLAKIKNQPDGAGYSAEVNQRFFGGQADVLSPL